MGAAYLVLPSLGFGFLAMMIVRTLCPSVLVSRDGSLINLRLCESKKNDLLRLHIGENPHYRMKPL